MNRLSWLAAGATIALMPVGPLALPAQAPAIAPGSRVRARVVDLDQAGRAQQTERHGTLVAGPADVLVVLPDRRTKPDTVPLFTVTRLYVSRGRRSRAMLVLRGAGVGLATGVVAGLAFGSVPNAGNDTDEVGGAIDRAFSILFGGLGLIVGTVAGAAQSAERWQRVAPPRTAYDARRGRSALTLGWRVGF